jgi:hypothetical protein
MLIAIVLLIVLIALVLGDLALVRSLNRKRGRSD